MAFRVAVVSGKGGTGKTTISVQLAHFLSQQMNYDVQLIDCDVEEPNDLLFFKNKQHIFSKTINQYVAKIEDDKCKFCRDCVEYCMYNAIVVIPTVKYAKVDKNLCHSCGACLVACKHNSIIEVPEPIGEVSFYKISPKLSLAEGRLKIGSTMQTMLIGNLKKNVNREMFSAKAINILDAPPGTSCSVVETIADVDKVIVVAEPTPFGVHDFKLIINLLREMDKHFTVIINKATDNSGPFIEEIEEENVNIIGIIPFEKDIAKSYATGNLISNIDKNKVEIFTNWFNENYNKVAQ